MHASAYHGAETSRLALSRRRAKELTAQQRALLGLSPAAPARAPAKPAAAPKQAAAPEPARTPSSLGRPLVSSATCLLRTGSQAACSADAITRGQ